MADEREGGVVFLITSSPFFTWMMTGSHLVLRGRRYAINVRVLKVNVKCWYTQCLVNLHLSKHYIDYTGIDSTTERCGGEDLWSDSN